MIIVVNNTEYQRELAKSLIEDEDLSSAYELAIQFGWEGAIEQIRFNLRVAEFI